MKLYAIVDSTNRYWTRHGWSLDVYQAKFFSTANAVRMLRMFPDSVAVAVPGNDLPQPPSPDGGPAVALERAA